MSVARRIGKADSAGPASSPRSCRLCSSRLVCRSISAAHRSSVTPWSVTRSRTHLTTTGWSRSALALPAVPVALPLRIRFRPDRAPHEGALGRQGLQRLPRGRRRGGQDARHDRAAAERQGRRAQARDQGSVQHSYDPAHPRPVDTGLGDQFYKQNQLHPEDLIEAAKKAGKSSEIDIQLREGYVCCHRGDTPLTACRTTATGSSPRSGQSMSPSTRSTSRRRRSVDRACKALSRPPFKSSSLSVHARRRERQPTGE